MAQLVERASIECMVLGSSPRTSVYLQDWSSWFVHRLSLRVISGSGPTFIVFVSMFSSVINDYHFYGHSPFLLKSNVPTSTRVDWNYKVLIYDLFCITEDRHISHLSYEFPLDPLTPPTHPPTHTPTYVRIFRLTPTPSQMLAFFSVGHPLPS